MDFFKRILAPFLTFFLGKKNGKEQLINKQNKQLIKNVQKSKKRKQERRNDDIDTVKRRMSKFLRNK